uniref:BHLH domain-containing protein n=1 Tax=Davidia involucrata TaxID=16924 RepID=A0A5B7AA69_DAVIN
MMQSSSSSSKLERNAMEKKRRMQMKDHFSRLASLVIEQTSKERLPSHVLLDKATTYVKQLKENVEELKGRKEKFKGSGKSMEDNTAGSTLPVLAVRDKDSTLEVNLITGLNTKFMLHEIITLLEEEGAQVVSASYSTVGSKIFYTIHSQAIWSRIGIETSRVHERLKKLVF